MLKRKELLHKSICILLLLVMLLSSVGAVPALAAPVTPAGVAGLPLLDTVADRIIYPYCSTIGSTTQGSGFSSSVAWRASSDAGVGYFQQASPNMAVGAWVRKQFTVAKAGNYRVEFIYKGGSGRGYSQFYLYPAADFPSGGSVTGAYSVAGPFDMNTMTYSANVREASNPSDPARILQTSTKAVNNYLSYNLGDYVLSAGDYAVETRVTTAGLPVLVAVMLVPYGEPATAPGVTLDKTEMTLDLTSKPADTVASTVNTEDGWGGIVWASSDNNVATVTGDSSGATVTAIGKGTATITAAVTKGGDTYSSELQVTVGETPVVTLNPASLMLNTVGNQSAAVSAAVADGYTITGWASDNTSVAAVTPGGAGTATVTAVAEGNANIVCTVSRTSDGAVTTAAIPVTVLSGAQSQIDITYKNNQDKVLSVSPANGTVTVALGTNAGELTGAAVKTTGADITAEVLNKAASSALVSGDLLKVAQGGLFDLYTVIVVGDKGSTDIAAKNLDSFSAEIHGSNIGKIDLGAAEITLVDGMARYFTIEESIALGKANGKAANRDTYTTTGQGGVSGAVAGRHRSLRSCSEIAAQLESLNGTAQAYRIVNTLGVQKTSEFPVTGDKLIVTSEDGSMSKTFDIKVGIAALSGRLEVTSGPSTVGETGDLVLEYHAGQRTPEAEVVITLPPGIDAKLDNTYVNIIGRGEIVLSKFHLSRGNEIGGVFERLEMHKLLGRFSVDYPYQTLGTVAITGDAAAGKTITFNGLDLRPNNGADIVLRFEDVSFDTAMAYDFSAAYKTKAATITSNNPAYASFGEGSEAAQLNVVHRVTSLTRVIYSDNNFAERENDLTKHNVLNDLEYKAGVRAGDYTGFEMTWQAPAGAVSVTLEHATGTIGSGGAVTLNDNWAPAPGVTVAPGATSLKLTGLAANTYHRYRLNVTGGGNPGYSNEIGFYSGMLSATQFGAAAGSANNKNAINRAIAWLHSIGGGTLTFPPNGTSYKFGTIYLKSNVYLYLPTGSFLESQAGWMDDPESAWWCYRDYGSGTNSSEDPYANPNNFLSKQDDGHCFYQNAMFYARRENNMKIIGTGRLKGTGIPNGDGTVHSGAPGARADDMIALKLCTNFELGGISNGLNLAFDKGTVYLYHKQTPNGPPGSNGDPTINSTPIWVDDDGVFKSRDVSNMLQIDDGGHFATLFGACDHMNVHDVYYGYNQRAGRDVFDFMENNDVHVTNIMASGVSDDIVAPKSDCAMGFTRPVSGYWIRNIVGDTNCNNFQIGSETADDIQDIYIDNLVVLGANKCGFSISTNDGGYMRNINLNTGGTGKVLPGSDYFIRTSTPIFISISHRGRVLGAENRTVSGERVITNVPIGRIEDITLNNVDITEAYSGTAYSSGYYPRGSQRAYTSVIVGYAMPNGTAGVTHNYNSAAITAGYPGNYTGMPDGRLTGYIKNCTFNNVDILMQGGNSATNRSRTCPELNVGQYNSTDMGDRPAYGLYVTHAENFVMNGGKLGFEQNDNLYPLVLNDVLGAEINNVIMDKGTGNGTVTGNNADGLIQARRSANITINGLRTADVPTPTVRLPQAITGNANAAQIVRGADNRSLTSMPNTQGFGDLSGTVIYPRDVPALVIDLQLKAGQTAVKSIETGIITVNSLSITVQNLKDSLIDGNTPPLSLSFVVTDTSGVAKADSDTLFIGDTLTASADDALSKSFGILIDGVELKDIILLAKPGAAGVTYANNVDSVVTAYQGTGVSQLKAELIDGNSPALTLSIEVTSASGEIKGDGDIVMSGDKLIISATGDGAVAPDRTFTVWTEIDDSIPVTGLSLYRNERGAVVAQYTASGADDTAHVFVAAYGSNGKLLAMTDGGARKIPVSGKLFAVTEVVPGAAVYKAFAWDKDFVPLTGSVSKINVAATGVTLNRSSIELRKGMEFMLTAAVAPSNSLHGKVKWTTDNARVALVNGNGKITAAGVGTARVSAVTNDGRSAVCTVTVVDAYVGVRSVAITRTALTLALGETGLIGAYVVPVYADNQDIAWSSSDAGVAEVSAAGFITAKAVGVATITAAAADGGAFAACALTVSESMVPYNLNIPREAVTYDACTLLWDKPSNLYTTDLKEYMVYSNGVLIGTTTKMGYSVSGLSPDTEYTFRVDAKRKDDTVETGPGLSVRTKTAPPKVINVTDAPYGAVADGGWSGTTRVVNPDLNGVVVPNYKEARTAASNTGTPVNNPANRTTGTLNTEAIQRAIDDCPLGGEVYIPEGTFLSGPLFLKSNMTLRIDGELIATTDVTKYPKIISMFEGWEIPQTFASLLTIGELDTFGDYNIHDVYICGNGRIDASGLALDFVQTSASTTVGEQTAIRKRGRAVVLHNAQDIYFRDLDIGFGPSWTLHAILSDHITYDSMIIQGKVKGTDNGASAGSASRVRNGDGIGCDSTTNVNIFNTIFHCGDDSITIKCGKNESGWRRNKPVMNIRATNNILPQSQGGIVIGSEMSGGVRNVLVQDNRIIQDGWEAFDIKSDIGRGGLVSTIVVKDLDITGARIGARVSFKYSTNNDGDKAPVSPEVDGVLLENFFGNVTTAFEIVGINGATTTLSPNDPARESKIRNVMILNCNLISGTKSYSGVQGNVTCNAVLQDCNGVTVRNVTIRGTGSGNPVVARPWGVLDSENINLDYSQIINAPNTANTAIRVRAGQSAVKSLSGTTLTVDSEATVAAVKAGVMSTDGSIQSYAYTNSADAPKADTAIVAPGDKLVVTAQNGVATAVYTIAVQNAAADPIVFPIITSTPYVKGSLGAISTSSDTSALGGSYQQFNSTGYAVGAWVEYTFGAAPGTAARPAIPAGTYDVVFRYRINGTVARGFVQMAIDGVDIGAPVNQLLREDGTTASGVVYPELKIGTRYLSGGDHVFRFTVTTGGSGNVNFDGIMLIPVTP